MRIEILNPSYLHNLWPVVEAMLSKSMNHATCEMTLDQVKVYISNGQYGLLFFIDDNDHIVGTVIYSWINYPNERVFYVYAIAGKTNQFYVDEMFKFARSQGATLLRGIARESVARLWEMKYGLNKVCYVVEKRL